MNNDSGRRALNELINVSAEKEELNAELRSNEFTARMGKLFKLLLALISPLSIVIGVPVFLVGDKFVGLLFGIIGLCGLIVLPTLLSWKCTVNKESMTEQYFILFIRRTKKVLWSAVKYKKVSLDTNKNIVFYSENRKRLISFDGSTVGFNLILRMAKKKGIADLKK